jgi:hypothetical protein
VNDVSQDEVTVFFAAVDVVSLGFGIGFGGAPLSGAEMQAAIGYS